MNFKNKTTVLFLVFIIFLSINSCTKKKDPSPVSLEEQIVGNWKITDFSNNGLTAKEFSDYLDNVKKFVTVNFEFRKDKILVTSVENKVIETEVYELIGSNLDLGDIKGPITIDGKVMVLNYTTDKVFWTFTKQ